MKDIYINAAKELITGRHGSFAAYIGEAYLVADPSNKDKLLQTFWEIFRHAEQIRGNR